VLRKSLQDLTKLEDVFGKHALTGKQKSNKYEALEYGKKIVDDIPMCGLLSCVLTLRCSFDPFTTRRIVNGMGVG
jgi:hypothetical protein